MLLKRRIVFFLGMSGPPGWTKLHLVAKMDDLDVKMCNHENEFAEVLIRGKSLSSIVFV